jgi:hypothetical protein
MKASELLAPDEVDSAGDRIDFASDVGVTFRGGEKNFNGSWFEKAAGVAAVLGLGGDEINSNDVLLACVRFCEETPLLVTCISSPVGESGGVN